MTKPHKKSICLEPAGVGGRVSLALALLCCGIVARAEDAKDTSNFEGGEAGNNWIEFGAGGMFNSGSDAQAAQTRRVSTGAFGGIQDLHFQKEIAKLTTFSVDGRGLFDENDYRLTLGVKKEEKYFFKFNFENFRTYSNGDGGYFPPTDTFYPLQDDPLELDRGEFSFEGGLTLDALPKLRFKYSHLYRDGEKGSTAWGPTHPQLTYPTRGLLPTVDKLDETRDVFELDAEKRIKKTDVGLGLRYEFGDLKDERRISRYPGEPAVAGVAQDRKITGKQDLSYDLFNVHAFTETWLKPNLFLSSGFMYSDLDNDVSGSRIWGDDFDVMYAPNAANGQGYTNLLGHARKHDYVANLNLMSQWTDALTVTPSIRIQSQDWDADSSANSTFGVNTFGPTESSADGDALDVRERLDVRYTGITNWVFTTQGEWTQGDGSLKESGGIFNAINNPGAPIDRDTDETRQFQKYSVGAKWYATRRVSVDFGGYYKENRYEYDHSTDSTPNNSIANRYPAYLTLNSFKTYDGRLRLTVRPRSNLTLVSRYEYQRSTVETGPDPASGLDSEQSSELTSHILSQNVSWMPHPRLTLQLGANYVHSELETPASDYSQAILESQNNYWVLNLNSGFVLDDKTDLDLGYTWYRADNYEDNSNYGVPYGSGAEEHGINITLVRRFSAKVRWTLRYGYYTFTDEAAGGNNDYDAHVLYSGLQYRF